MFLRAGALSLALLVASRLLGLLRETAQAAAFGASGLADVAVLMLTLPDWMASLVASGALAYVMLPAWSGQSSHAIAAGQRRLARVLLAAGLAIGVTLALSRDAALDLLAPGLGASLRSEGAEALWFSGAALPLALLASLWATRLQHEREFVGMYGANLVVNAVLIATLWLLAAHADAAVVGLGSGLLAAMALRLVWLHGRLPRHELAREDREIALPPPATWWWAALAAGLPLALPFAARSAASADGEGALAVFNYAWKLVELPLVLAIQLVATLAFPGIARAFAQPQRLDEAEVRLAVRPAFALAWTLACAAAAGVILGAPALAHLLFGWGRMTSLALVHVAEWGRIGAWGLLPQAVIAVALTILAARRRMRVAVLAYAAALALLLAAAAAGFNGGAAMMLTLDMVLAAIAAVLLIALRSLPRCIPWRTMTVAAATLLILVLGTKGGGILPANDALQLGIAACAAALVLVATSIASPELRTALRR
ncbi:MAG TPA: lipid II flippase MurJ [Ramlibacter sp.]|uniref:lipid II flippase MurJ n=1 Tax=Ramlibacter sp. TaxID=1917967 RepID=UPI002B6BE0B0|nr:lipid II flippase MurJ [Ramlibacter sp.]HVZ45342.1 lipid II flippase MurJ [Ramlibacter sp.]